MRKGDSILRKVWEGQVSASSITASDWENLVNEVLRLEDITGLQFQQLLALCHEKQDERIAQIIVGSLVKVRDCPDDKVEAIATDVTRLAQRFPKAARMLTTVIWERPYGLEGWKILGRIIADCPNFFGTDAVTALGCACGKVRSRDERRIILEATRHIVLATRQRGINCNVGARFFLLENAASVLELGQFRQLCLLFTRSDVLALATWFQYHRVTTLLFLDQWKEVLRAVCIAITTSREEYSVDDSATIGQFLVNNWFVAQKVSFRPEYLQAVVVFFPQPESFQRLISEIIAFGYTSRFLEVVRAVEIFYSLYGAEAEGKIRQVIPEEMQRDVFAALRVEGSQSGRY